MHFWLNDTKGQISLRSHRANYSHRMKVPEQVERPFPLRFVWNHAAFWWHIGTYWVVWRMFHEHRPQLGQRHLTYTHRNSIHETHHSIATARISMIFRTQSTIHSLKLSHVLTVAVCSMQLLLVATVHRETVSTILNGLIRNSVRHHNWNDEELSKKILLKALKIYNTYWPKSKSVPQNVGNENDQQFPTKRTNFKQLD